MNTDAYSIFVGVAMTLVFAVTFFGLKFSGWPRLKIYKNLLAAAFFIYLLAKSLASIGFYLSFGEWVWAPATVMGFLFFMVVFAKRWAMGQGRAGQKLLMLWSFSIPLAQAIGRLGCYCQGCCFIRAPHTFPWPLLEATGTLVLSVALFFSRKKLAPLVLFNSYLVGYLVLRFVLEFWRGDLIRGVWGPLSWPQWECLFLFSWLFLENLATRYHNKGA